MSKNIKKFRKNDYSDDQEFSRDARDFEDKRASKRVDRALRTKDISALMEADDEEDDMIDMYGYVKEEY